MPSPRWDAESDVRPLTHVHGAQYTVRSWKEDILTADVKELRDNIPSEVYVKWFKAKAVIASTEEDL